MNKITIFLIVLLASATAASAQQPSLEELQRRIEQSKAEKSRKDAAAGKAAAEKASAERKAEADERAQSARLATLIVRTDADCELSLNGKPHGMVTAGGTQEFKAGAGEQLVECKSREDSSVSATQVKALQAGGQAVLLLALKEQVVRSQRERERACDMNVANMTEQGSGVLRQCKTGLEWTQSDNGSDISWHEATQYCASKGGGWRLGTADELKGLYDTTGPLGTSCGKWICTVSPKFRLTSGIFWSSDRQGSAEAWGVYLLNGTRAAGHVEDRGSLRALCVRRP